MTEFAEGDHIELVKGKEKVAGIVQINARMGVPFFEVGTPTHRTAFFPRDLMAQGYTLTTIEKALPPLPTEPGIYISYVNTPSPTIFHLTKRLGWVDANDKNYMDVNELAKMMPLTRLAPVAEVLGKIREQGLTVTESRDAPYLTIDLDRLDVIATEYGVTK